MIRRRASLLLVSCLLAAACSDDPELTGSAADGDPAPAPARTQSSEPAGGDEPQPAAEPSGSADDPFPANTARDVGEPSGGPLGVKSIRVARQDGYDRVVFELGGRNAGEPGWTVEYTDDPRQDGSGNPVEVQGEATLEVRISGVGYPMDTGVADAPGQPAVPPAAEVVEEVEDAALFEGVFQAFVGTSRKAPFRVFRLADPPRVVVDVRHD